MTTLLIFVITWLLLELGNEVVPSANRRLFRIVVLIVALVLVIFLNLSYRVGL